MKQKENIFEELNKMRNLIHTKPGVVISEQIILSERDAVAGTDDDLISISQLLNSPIDTTQKQINSIAPSFSNRKSVIFKSPNNSTYVFFRFKPGGYWNPQNFVLKISGQQKTFGTFDLQNIYFKSPSTPESQWGQDSGFNTIVPIASIKGSDTPATRTPEAINNINANFCSVRDGKINTGGAFKGRPWTDYKATYKVTDAEEQEAKKSCPTVQVGSGSGQRSGQSSVNNRFASSVKSLGIQGDKMDLQTLQSILKTLEGGQSTAAATGTPTAAATGTPDIAQLTAALNQLQA